MPAAIERLEKALDILCESRLYSSWMPAEVWRIINAGYEVVIRNKETMKK